MTRRKFFQAVAAAIAVAAKVPRLPGERRVAQLAPECCCCCCEPDSVQVTIMSGSCRWVGVLGRDGYATLYPVEEDREVPPGAGGAMDICIC